jgi:hypothetical protein
MLADVGDIYQGNARVYSSLLLAFSERVSSVKLENVKLSILKFVVWQEVAPISRVWVAGTLDTNIYLVFQAKICVCNANDRRR